MELASLLQRNPDIVRRLGVTVAALLLYRFGCAIPLPGVDTSAPAVAAGSFERVSIMALGLMPILSAVVLMEILLIAWPRLRASGSRNPGDDTALGGWVIWGALALAALQGNGVAAALESGGPGIVPSPGLAFRTGVVVSTVAATAVLLWLASVITQHGIGRGFWVLLGASYLIAMVSPLVGEILRSGTHGIAALALAAGFLAVTVMAFAGVTRSTPAVSDSDELLWALVLGMTVANWAVVVIWGAFALAQPDAAMDGLGVFGSPAAQLALSVAGLVAVIVLRRRSFAKSGLVIQRATSAVPVIVALAGLLAAGHLLREVADVPLVHPVRVMLIAAIGLAILEKMTTSPARSS